MPPPMPELPGVRHAEHDLPTGVRVHVAEAGDPGAPPLLLVHGWPSTGGRGGGDAARGTLPRDRARSPRLRLERAAGRRRLREGAARRRRPGAPRRAGDRARGYLGHDWGAWTGLLLALRAPERLTRLMAVSIAASVGGPRGDAPQRLAARLPAPDRGARRRPGPAPRRPAAARRARAAGRPGAAAVLRRRAAGARAGRRLRRPLPHVPAARAARARGRPLAGARLEVPVSCCSPRGDGAQAVPAPAASSATRPSSTSRS